MDNIQRLVAELRDPDEMIRRNAAEDLGDYRTTEAVFALAEALNDSSRGVSEAAAESLVMIGTEKVVHVVVPLLASENTFLRNYAKEILAQLGETAVPSLIESLNNEDRDVRKFAIDALEEINSPKSIPCVVKAVEDPDINIAAVAVEVLGRLGDETVIPSIIDHMDGNSWMNGACLRALGEVGTEKALEFILDRLKNPGDLIEVFAGVQALGRIGSPRSIGLLLDLLKKQPDIFAEAVIVALESIIRQHQEMDLLPYIQDVSLESLFNTARTAKLATRLDAIELLGNIGYTYSVPFLVGLFYEPNGEIRKMALNAVLQLKPKDLSHIYNVLHDSEAPMPAKANAIDAIGQLKPEDGLQQIITFLESENLTLRRVAIDALYHPLNQDTLKNLKENLENPIVEIRIHTLKAINRLNLRELMDDIIPFLHDEDFDVRYTADQTFISLASDNKDLVHPFMNSFNQDERQMAFEYFKDHIATEFTPLLLKGLTDPKWEIRNIAIKALVNTDPENAADLIKDCFNDESENVVIAAIRAYAELKGDLCRARLEKILNESNNSRYIYEAITALGRIGNPAVTNVILPFLGNKDIYIKLGAIEALKDIGGDQASNALRELYASEEEDEVLDVLEDALDAVA